MRPTGNSVITVWAARQKRADLAAWTGLSCNCCFCWQGQLGNLPLRAKGAKRDLYPFDNNMSSTERGLTGTVFVRSLAKSACKIWLGLTAGYETAETAYAGQFGVGADDMGLYTLVNSTRAKWASLEQISPPPPFECTPTPCVWQRVERHKTAVVAINFESNFFNGRGTRVSRRRKARALIIQSSCKYIRLWGDIQQRPVGLKIVGVCFPCSGKPHCSGLFNQLLFLAPTMWSADSQVFLSSLQRSTAVQVRSSVWLMPQIQPSGRGLLPSPTA